MAINPQKMKKDLLSRRPVGPGKKNEPKAFSEVLKEYFESNESLAVAMRKRRASVNADDEKGWYRNTALGINLKTFLRHDRIMKPGKWYTGVFTRDDQSDPLILDEHYTFIETVPATTPKRNPHVFSGDFISITKKYDGTLRPNFKRMPAGMSVDSYIIGVVAELRLGLHGLEEE